MATKAKQERRAILVDIENVNGIKAAKIEVRVGVNELAGGNGAGKTSAFRAMARLFGDSDALVEPFDGAEYGTVEGDGVKLLVRDKVKSAGRGTEEVAAMGPVVQLITGGNRKGAAERNKARLQALAALVDVRVDVDDVPKLVKEPWLVKEVQKMVCADGGLPLLEAAEGARVAAMERARIEESEAALLRPTLAAAKRRLDGIVSELDAMGLTFPDPPADGNALDQANMRSMAAESARTARAADEAYRNIQAAHQVKQDAERQNAETLAGLPLVNDDEDAAMLAVNAAYQYLQQSEQLKAANDEALEAARATLAKAQEQATASTHRLVDARREHARTQSEAVTLQIRKGERQSLAERLKQPVPGPTEDDVNDAGAKMAETEFAATRDRLHMEAAIAHGELHQAILDQITHEKCAIELRADVAKMHESVGAFLRDAGVQGLTVVDGELAALVDGKPVDFDTRLSTGQKIRAALKLAAPRLHGVVFLDAEYWLAIDDAGRKEVDAAAVELGLIVVTERPDAGPLRMEHVQ